MNSSTADGWTPLLIAAREGNADVIGAILAAGADVNASAAVGGWTALMIGEWSAPLVDGARADLHADPPPEPDPDAGAREGHTAAVRRLLDGGWKLACIRAQVIPKRVVFLWCVVAP